MAQFTLNGKPDSSGPPPHELADQRRQLMEITSRVTKEEPEDQAEEEVPDASTRMEEIARRSAAPVMVDRPIERVAAPVQVPAPVVYPAWMEDIARRLEKPGEHRVAIRINGVGIKLSVLGHHVDGSKICFLVSGDIQCELPDSSDVSLEIGGKTIKTGFLGQWHEFPFLPFKIVCFVGPEIDEGPQDP